MITMTGTRKTRATDGSLLSPQRCRAIFSRLRAANPAPKSDLNYSTPFELLTAVMLSAHTTDKSVNGATARLFPAANTPAQIAALGVEGVKPYLKTIGLYNAKAANLVALCRQLVQLHGAEVPRDREALEALPGVGRKTANVVLNIAFGHETIAVDTHIFRVGNRTGLAPGKTPAKVEQVLNAVTPREFRRHAHHWLLLHGRYVCQARMPRCPECVIRDLCDHEPKTPAKQARPARVTVTARRGPGAR